MKSKPIKGLVFILVLVFLSLSFNHVFAQPPEYAKWGKTAVEETVKKYPDSELVNYDYNGKVIISEDRSQYNFKFTLNTANGQKKEVLVYVLVNQKSDQLIDVHFDELGSPN
ncbi:DUF3889 domain-containing protein [Halobacillus litoralis]|uniref:DUF3889 domain-containing protein n=1 Tax=Halobacillus litoralis TaxID=45668 RepID=A0A410M847_9BACI|nr:DUF3889 domain-containing protein [Halobacillus litoralis]QAS50873.1 hypothetical protein HLI_01000 [Halobacillus litoralis]